MNRVLIDTDILSYFLKGDEKVVANFTNYLNHFEILEISVITYYEIESGLKAKKAASQLKIFEEFINHHLILSVTEGSAKISSDLYGSLKLSGKVVDDMDLLIAGIAIENNMSLATNNEKHFERIPGLTIQNWKKQIY